MLNIAPRPPLPTRHRGREAGGLAWWVPVLGTVFARECRYHTGIAVREARAEQTPCMAHLVDSGVEGPRHQ